MTQGTIPEWGWTASACPSPCSRILCFTGMDFSWEAELYFRTDPWKAYCNIMWLYDYWCSPSWAYRIQKLQISIYTYRFDQQSPTSFTHTHTHLSNIFFKFQTTFGCDCVLSALTSLKWPKITSLVVQTGHKVWTLKAISCAQNHAFKGQVDLKYGPNRT